MPWKSSIEIGRDGWQSAGASPSTPATEAEAANTSAARHASVCAMWPPFDIPVT